MKLSTLLKRLESEKNNINKLNDELRKKGLPTLTLGIVDFTIYAVKQRLEKEKNHGPD